MAFTLYQPLGNSESSCDLPYVTPGQLNFIYLHVWNTFRTLGVEYVSVAYYRYYQKYYDYCGFRRPENT